MKRVYVNEEWCLGCHLCEIQCAFANSGEADMVKAFNNSEQKPLARITVEDGENDIHFAVSCRHCETPYCVKGCITGALTVNENGIVQIDDTRCVGCRTCILMCPYGCLTVGHNKTLLKCELCVENLGGEPSCVRRCPNNAIVFEDRDGGLL
ncbi:MAG: 4Fe-4S binding protein [Eubacteriaceae bacterium]|nr:4Fe-4S binding protein [Eubacteriaceae bacterium]